MKSKVSKKLLALTLVLLTSVLVVGCNNQKTSKMEENKVIDNEERNTDEAIQNESNELIIGEEPVVSIKNRIPYHKMQLTMNYSKGVEIKPVYLVIHETANTRAGATASAHYRYWSSNPSANASTHFVVDSEEIYQMLELNQMAWHVGDNKGYSDITNTNSIGIEICVNSDGDFEKARQNAIDLAIEIMNELHMSIDQLKTHHDASGKNCPTNMLKDRLLLIDFYNQVEKGLKQ